MAYYISIHISQKLFKDNADDEVHEKNLVKEEQKPNVLLTTIKERFAANLDETENSIIFLSVIQQNGMEVNKMKIKPKIN